MNCAICNEKAGILPAKIYNGHICHHCRSLLPYNIVLKTAEAGYLQEICEKNAKKKKVFETTAYLGDLYLDSIHNMFCVSKRKRKGEPLDFGEVHYVNELTGIALVCSNVRNIGTNGRDNVVCDIKFAFEVDGEAKDFIVERNRRCYFTYKGNQLDWSEPAEMQVFRSMIDQMIDTVCDNLLERLAAMQEAAKTLEAGLPKPESWARGVLFIDEKTELTAELIKGRYRLLMKIFHPDSGFEHKEVSEMLNQAKDTLS